MKKTVCRCHNLGDDWVIDIPDEIPRDGLICTAQNMAGKEIRFGVWLMPDNKSPGMLETFLSELVIDQDLWGYAEDVIQEAKAKGGSFKDVHQAKANIHTWLAWHDEPGMGFGVAIAKEHLNPFHPYLEPFIQWFKKLYGLAPSTNESKAEP